MCGDNAMKPTVNNSMITVPTMASKGAAAPFPIEIIKGVLATITVSGAAVATTINTIALTPSVPRSATCFGETVIVSVDGIVDSQFLKPDGWTGLTLFVARFFTNDQVRASQVIPLSKNRS